MMKRIQPITKTVLNYSTFAEYEKSAKMSTGNKIEQLEIECVKEQIKKT